KADTSLPAVVAARQFNHCLIVVTRLGQPTRAILRPRLAQRCFVAMSALGKPGEIVASTVLRNLALIIGAGLLDIHNAVGMLETTVIANLGYREFVPPGSPRGIIIRLLH